MAKKKWKKPELLVLVRGKPEEYVLTSCKLVSGGAGSGASYGSCFYPRTDVHLCDTCIDHGYS